MTSSIESGSASSSSQTSFGLSNGLIEITALTSLIGSTSTQSLSLGNKGPAGFVWATMTIFSAATLVKTGISTVTPGWLRDTLGVRSPEADAAVGLSLNLESKGVRYRTRSGVAQAIECEVEAVNRSNPTDVGRRDIHVLDQRMANILNAVSPSQPGESLNIYIFIPNTSDKEATLLNASMDAFWLFLSLGKLIEIGLLWRSGAMLLAQVTLASWLFFFICSVILEVHTLFLHGNNSASKSEIDVVAGTLPSSSTPGGPRTIMLGIPKEKMRSSHVWRIVWAVSIFVSITSIIGTYIALGQAESAEVFMIWTIFQLVWLALKSTLFHIAEDCEKPYHANLQGQAWSKLSMQEKSRVRGLIFALARYQRHIHRRKYRSYDEDLELVTKLENIQKDFPLDPVRDSTINVTVSGVIGDTIISSVSWIEGSTQGGFDFYDTCIVLLRFGEKIMAIPAARVLSGMKPSTVSEVEEGKDRLRPPRGLETTAGYWNEWCYWIPCGHRHWLYFTSAQMKIKGSRHAVVLTDKDVTALLQSGMLYVSLQTVDEIKSIVDTSRMACGYLLKYLDGPQDV